MSTSQPSKETGLHQSILKRILELLTAALSLVAALAWNDAIQSLFSTLFGPGNGLAAKFMYAILVTALIVGIGVRLSRISKKLEE